MRCQRPGVLVGAMMGAVVAGCGAHHDRLAARAPSVTGEARLAVDHTTTAFLASDGRVFRWGNSSVGAPPNLDAEEVIPLAGSVSFSVAQDVLCGLSAAGRITCVRRHRVEGWIEDVVHDTANPLSRISASRGYAYSVCGLAGPREVVCYPHEGPAWVWRTTAEIRFMTNVIGVVAVVLDGGEVVRNSMTIAAGVEYPLTQAAVPGLVELSTDSWTPVCGRFENGGVGCWDDTDAAIDRLGELRMVPLEGALEVEGMSNRAHPEHQLVCARTADEVWCWGTRGCGEVAAGHLNTYGVLPSPVPVPSSCAHEVWVAPERVELPGRPVEIAVGQHHGCALLEDDSVWCWGGNYRGQLGDGTLVDSAAPVRVLGLPGGA